MTPDGLVGLVLISGLVCFLVGAVRWKLAYEQPLAAALPLIHVDRRRRTWIHIWMIIGLVLTSAGLLAATSIAGGGMASVGTAIAATTFALGSVCFIVSLAFRLTVTAWAAERAHSERTPVEIYEALDAWAGTLYVVHMSAAYATFLVLGASVLAFEGLPAWLGWVGIGWGALFLGGFVVTRFSGWFNPPWWAHSYPSMVGVLLLT